MSLPPVFHRLAWSNLAGQSAEQVALAAAPILAVLVLGSAEGATGLLQTAQTLPFLLAAIPAGLLADRLPRAQLMAAAEALRLLALLGILALIATGGITLFWLALLGLIGACGTVAFSVAAPALVPALVPRDALPRANSRIELARTSALAAGPAVAGALLGWLGAAPAFVLAAVLSGVAVLLLAGIAEQPRPRAPARHPLREVREGIRFVADHPLLRPIFVTQFVFNTALFVIHAVFVPYAIRRLGLDAAGVGLVLGTFGAGMVAGAAAAPRIMARLRLGLVVGIGPVSGFAAALLIALTALLPSAWLAGAGFFLMGAGPVVWVVSTTTLRQQVTPDALLGRVSAINGLAWGARPVGAAIGAGLGALLGAEACLILAAVFFLAQMLVILRSPVVALGAPGACLAAAD